jgi:hypothetical protein
MASPRLSRELWNVSAVVGENTKPNAMISMFAYLINLCGIVKIRLNVMFKNILSCVSMPSGRTKT